MQRREFYILVAETGLNPRTVRGYCDGKAQTHRASAKLIEDTAKGLGIEISPVNAEAV